MWGKQVIIRKCAEINRSTPTRVGKTDRLSLAGLQRKVHPHACGENDRVLSNGFRGHGPPPRVWGKLLTSCGSLDLRRSTPTRVGKTSLPSSSKSILSVHPHACGENRGRVMRYVSKYGPPPRVWGKRIGRFWKRQRGRSTPTRVGKTFRARTRRARAEVHPHACGENEPKISLRVRSRGPPPRVWGKHWRQGYRLGSCRSTPTRVGKTRY